MRYVAFCLLLFLGATRAQTGCDLPSILNTKHALIVGANGCIFSFEDARVEEGQCPKTLTSPLNSPSNCTFQNAQFHLLRDKSGNKRPRILAIGQSPSRHSSNLEVQMFEDDLSRPIKVEPFALAHRALNQTFENARKISLYAEHVRWKYSLFDSFNKLLYILYGNGQVNCYLYNEYGGRSPFLNMMTFRADSKFTLRSNYVEDPYEQAVYYTEQNNGKMEVYKVPHKDLLIHLVRGNPGEVVASFEEERNIVAITSGVIFSRLATGEQVINQIGDLSDMAKKCDCEGTTYASAQASFLVIRDADYCMTVHDDGPMRAKCLEELNPVIEEREPDSDWTWLVVLILVLCTMIVILMLLSILFWLRSRRSNRQYKAEVEKVRFLNDQAGLGPSSYYPNSSTGRVLDQSVDRWHVY
ncbi:unnamed protein product, partial [Mesorhabditis spiculigera]